MSTYGQQTIATVGRAPKVSADGCPLCKHGGVTIDWGTVVAVASVDVTLGDGLVVKVGEKYLRYGQVITRITLTAVDVVTITGSPTGGTFTVSVTAGGSTQTTAGLAYNAAAATVQTAVQGLSNVGAGNATVTGSAGGPYTITFPDALGAVTVAASGAGLTGGTAPAATATQTAPGGDLGKYGPYDPAATDGRATLANGSAFIINVTMKENDLKSDYPVAIYGGLCFKDRIIQSGVGAHTLAVGPTLAELLAAFPQLQLVTD